jgi:hypothetical protein
MLHSYKKLPFTEVYLFIKLDSEFLSPGQYFVKNDLTDYLYNNFSNLPKEKVHIVHDRYTNQNQWIPFFEKLINKHGPNESVWFMQNDDHIFIDFNTDIVVEGLKHLEADNTRHKSIYLSHWPEILKLSGKQETPVLVNNYIKFHLSLLDSIQIFNLQFLYDIFVYYTWKNQNHCRIDSILNELCNNPAIDNPLSQTIYVPLREVCRHFDGYDHVRMDSNSCPKLELPSNTFHYSKEKLINKMTAKHSSVWTNNNHFIIPQKWIEINLGLHNLGECYTAVNKNDDILEYTPISLGWNCSPAINRANNYGYNKSNGYLTCPFDLVVTPYDGLCNCILDNFDRSKFFNLRVEYDPINKQDCILNEYDMWFNHESEQLYNNDKVEWHPGKWGENNFKLFKERYERRIENFNNYINKNNVLFIIENPHENINKIMNIIKITYPSLNFKILHTKSTKESYFNQHLHSPGFPKI